MGLLIPIEHPTRVEIRRAARVCRELGASSIGVETLRPRDVTEATYVISQLVPNMESVVRFERGPMPLDELAAVVLATDSPGMRSCVRLGGAEIRLWADSVKVYVTELPPGGLDAAKALAADAGLAANEVAYSGSFSAIEVTTADHAAAFRLFRSVAEPGAVHVTISSPGPSSLARLPAVFATSGAPASIDAHLANDVAATVTERVPCDRWQIDDLLYDPETGVLSTYLVAPVGHAELLAWFAKLDAALARAA